MRMEQRHFEIVKDSNNTFQIPFLGDLLHRTLFTQVKELARKEKTWDSGNVAPALASRKGIPRTSSAEG